MEPHAQLLHIVQHGETPRLIERYFDPRGDFGGATFNTLEPILPDDIVAADLLALTLLSVQVGPRGVRELLDESETTRADVLVLLKDLPPPEVTLWEATPDEIASADRLWRRLLDVSSIGTVVAGKLLARKRPRLVPIVDSTVKAVLGWSGYWETFRVALQDEALRNAIEDLREPAGVNEADVPTLRLLDAAIWMWGAHGPGGHGSTQRTRLT